MKKLILPALFLGAIAFGSTSCKKDYKCDCTYDGDTYSYDLKDVKKNDAKDACDAAGASWILVGGTCELN